MIRPATNAAHERLRDIARAAADERGGGGQAGKGAAKFNAPDRPRATPVAARIERTPGRFPEAAEMLLYALAVIGDASRPLHTPGAIRPAPIFHDLLSIRWP